MSFYCHIDDLEEDDILPIAATALEMSKNNIENMKRKDLKNIKEEIVEAIGRAETSCKIGIKNLYSIDYIKEILIAKGYKVKIDYGYPCTICKIDWSDEKNEEIN